MHSKTVFDLIGYVESTPPGQLVLWNERVKFKHVFDIEFMIQFGIESIGDAFLVHVVDETSNDRLKFEKIGNVKDSGHVSEQVLDISFLDT
jgi:hypothetical protein